MALLLDAVATTSVNYFTASNTITLTTLSPNDIIICIATSNQPTGALSISDTALLSWALRNSIIGTNMIWYWWALASSVVTGDVITINTTVAGSLILDAFAVNGANVSSPFDGAGVTGTSDPLSITTSNPNTFIFGSYSGNTQPVPTAGSGFSAITDPTNAPFMITEYVIETAIQTALSVAIGTGAGTMDVGIVDAIKQASSGPVGDSFGNQVKLLQMKRKSLGWTAPFFDPRRRVLRPNRSLLLPKNFKKAA